VSGHNANTKPQRFNPTPVDEEPKGAIAAMILITKKDITVPVTVQTRTELPPDRAFQPAVDLSLVFKGWGPFPAVSRVTNQTGAWDHVDASRNPILSDGSFATEKLTEYTVGHSFAYEVTGFTEFRAARRRAVFAQKSAIRGRIVRSAADAVFSGHRRQKSETANRQHGFVNATPLIAI
jgi:hypothetical protein